MNGCCRAHKCFSYGTITLTTIQIEAFERISVQLAIHILTVSFLTGPYDFDEPILALSMHVSYGQRARGIWRSVRPHRATAF